ncbi:hypothetical protein CapIbe_020306, partial [Capra ibex]
MSLTRTERTIILSLWSKISTQADVIEAGGGGDGGGLRVTCVSRGPAPRSPQSRGGREAGKEGMTGRRAVRVRWPGRTEQRLPRESPGAVTKAPARPQALLLLPAGQDLLPALRPALGLRAAARARLQGGGRRGRRGQEHRQRDERAVQAERAARLRAARGPGQLQVPVPLPAGHVGLALPCRLHGRRARRLGQVPVHRVRRPDGEVPL